MQESTPSKKSMDQLLETWLNDSSLAPAQLFILNAHCSYLLDDEKEELKGNLNGYNER